MDIETRITLELCNIFDDVKAANPVLHDDRLEEIENRIGAYMDYLESEFYEGPEQLVYDYKLDVELRNANNSGSTTIEALLKYRTEFDGPLTKICVIWDMAGNINSASAKSIVAKTLTTKKAMP